MVIAGCGGPDPVPPGGVDSAVLPPTAQSDVVDSATLPAAVLVDSGQSPSPAGSDGWNYHRSSTVDLNGDGVDERVVIAARVEMIRGRPAWDDGQQWQVYVAGADSSRTVVYARRLQLGTLTLRVDAGRAGAARKLVLLEHVPDRLAVYEVGYRGPGDFASTVLIERAVDPTGELASPALP